MKKYRCKSIDIVNPRARNEGEKIDSITLSANEAFISGSTGETNLKRNVLHGRNQQ